jgi:hypothetical protein
LLVFFAHSFSLILQEAFSPSEQVVAHDFTAPALPDDDFVVLLQPTRALKPITATINATFFIVLAPLPQIGELLERTR